MYIELQEYRFRQKIMKRKLEQREEEKGKTRWIRRSSGAI
jgi:hypothetical protein